jgi:hypothetical protein
VRPQDHLVTIPLSARDAALGDSTEDIRGLEVRDSFGLRIGQVEELLVDATERRLRLLRVRAPSSAGRPGPTRLIPVEAVWRITGDDVSVNRVRAHVEAGPADPGGEPDQRELERVYAHYGYYPCWEPGYVYPSYPALP